MLKISRELDLALLLMAEIYLKKILSLSEWTKKKKLPYRFLSKIAGKLRKAGLVKSREGRDGGYWITKEISVGAIIKAIEGNKGSVACLRGEQCQSFSYCHQRKILKKLNLTIEKQLNQISLASLCR